MFKPNCFLLRNIPYYTYIISSGNILPFFSVNYLPNKFIEVHPAFNNYLFKDCKKQFIGKEYLHDICFIGGLSKKHSNRWDIIESIYKKFKSFGIYCYGIDDVPDGYNFKKCAKPAIWHTEYINVLNSSKICVNLFLNGYSQLDSGLNQRSFEIPAAYSLQLVQNASGLKKIF